MFGDRFDAARRLARKGLEHRRLRLEPLEDRRLLAVDITSFGQNSTTKNLLVNYSVTGTEPAFTIDLFKSTDGVTVDDPTAPLMTVSEPSRTQGTYAASFTGSFTDPGGEYFLVAKPSVAGTSKVFAGAFRTAAGVVHVHDSDYGSTVTVRRGGDANGDGVIDIFDNNYVSANWDPVGPAGPEGDLNNDRKVDIFDYNYVWALPNQWQIAVRSSGPQNNDFASVYADASVSDLRIRTHGGDDVVRVQQASNYASAGPTLTTVVGGTGINTLTISSNNSADETIGMSNTQVVVGATTDYQDLAALNVDAAGGADTFIVYLTDQAPSLPASINLIGGSGADIDTVRVVGTAGVDTIDVAGNTVNVTGGPAVTLTASESLRLETGVGDDVIRLHYPLTGGYAVNIYAGAGSDLLDLSHNSLNASSALPNANEIELLDLSHNNYSTPPALGGGLTWLDLSHNDLTNVATNLYSTATTLTTLDLRYNELDLADSTELSPLSSLNALKTLYLHGNLGMDAPNLLAIAGKLLRVDLAPVGLEKAEQVDTEASALAGIAKALHYLPLEIYEYVLNNFEYQAYAGLMKAPLSTIQTRAGNDWDLSALLIKLLEQSGVTTAKFAEATSGARVLVPKDLALQWLGVNTAEAASELLVAAGLNPVARFNPPGVLYGWEIDHVWAEADLAAPAGTTRAVFDASWKLRDYRLGVPGITDAVAFNEQQFLSQVQTQLPYEFYEDAVAAYLAANKPGVSLADLAHDGTIRPQRFDVTPAFPSQLGFVVEDTLTSYAEVDAAGIYLQRFTPASVNQNDTHRIELKVDRWISPTQQVQLFTETRQIRDILLQPVTIRWSGDTAQLWIGNDPMTNPVATGVLGGPTDRLSLTINYFEPGSSTASDSKTYLRNKGQVIALAVEANHVNDLLLARSQKDVITAVIEAKPNPSLFDQADIATFLHTAGLTYFRRLDQAQNVLDGLAQTVQFRNYVQTGILSANGSVGASDFHWDAPNNVPMVVVPTNLFVDLQGGYVEAVNIDATTDHLTDNRSKARNKVVRHNFSAQEHALWEELLNSKSMSTIKSLQIANSSNPQIPIWTFDINSPNRDTYLSALVTALGTPFGPSVVGQSSDAAGSNTMWGQLKAGATITTPSNFTNLGTSGQPGYFHGIGYIADASTIPSNKYVKYVITDTSGQYSSGGYATNLFQPVTQIASNPFQNVAGDPVNVATGGVYEDVVDISIPNLGIPLTFARHYDSNAVVHPLPNGLTGDPTLGLGWFHSFSDQLIFLDAGSVTNNLTVWTDNHGSQFKFRSIQFTTDYYTPETIGGVPNHTFIDGEFRIDNVYVIKDNLFFDTAHGFPQGGYVGTYYFRDKEGITRRFKPISATQALLVEISDLNGNRLRIARDASNRILAIYNPEQPTIRLDFYYDGNGKLDRIEHLAGSGSTDDRVWQYLVEATGGTYYLKKVESPKPTPTADEITVTYSYYTDAPQTGTPVAGLLKDIKQLMALADANDDRTTSHTYYPSGRAFQTVDPEGNAQTFQYDLYRQRTTFIDERGHSTSHDFDDMGHETRVIMPDRATVKSKWSDQIPLAQRPAGLRDGLLVEQTDAFGLTSKLTYDLSVQNPNDVLASIWNNRKLGNVLLVQTGRYVNGVFSQISLTDYDIDGNTASLPLETAQTFDTRRINSPVLATYPNDHQVLQFSNRDSVQLPSVLTNARKSLYTYDDKGNMTRMSEPIRKTGSGPNDVEYSITDYVYADVAFPSSYPQGYQIRRLAKIVEPRGDHANPATTLPFTTQFLDYNEFGIPETVKRWIRTEGSTQIYAVDTSDYNTRGYLVWQKDANQYQTGVTDRTDYDVDALGRRTKMTQPVPGGFATRPEWFYDYDAAGSLVHTKDAEGRDASSTYDKLGRLVRTDNPDGSKIAVAYDPKGNVVATTDGLGNATRLVYDERDRLIQTILPDGAAATTRYDGMGHAVEQIDPLGRVTKSNYDQLGRMTRIVESAPGTLVDPENPLAGMLPARVWKYTYDAMGNRVLEQLATTTNGGATESAVDRTTQFFYDSLNRLVKRTDPDPDPTMAGPFKNSPQWTFVYDTAGNRTSEQLRETITNVLYQQTDFVYDGLSRMTQETRINTSPGNSVWSYGYDAVGNRTAVTDPRGYLTQYEYDRLNRLVERLDPEPQTYQRRVLYEYDRVGNIRNEIITDDELYPNPGPVPHIPVYEVASYSYDAMNRRVSELHHNVTYAGPQPPYSTNATRSTYEYDDAGNLLSSTVRFAAGYQGAPDDPRDQRTRFEYDSRNRRTTSIDPLGGVTKTAYDAVGNVLSSTDALLHTTTYVYDNLNRRVKSTLPPASGPFYPETSPVQTNVYNSVGDLATTFMGTVFDALQRRTDLEYDKLRRTKKVFEPLASAGGTRRETSYTYDVAGNRLTVTEPANTGAVPITTSYQYDQLNQLLEQIDPDPDGAGPGKARQWSYRYDKSGNLDVEKLLELPSGATLRHTEYDYDKLNRRTSEQRFDVATAALYSTTSFAYDTFGNLQTITDPLNRKTVRQYDALNRMTEENHLDAADQFVMRMSTTYDAASNVISSTINFAASGTDPLDRTTTFAYDALNRQVRGTDPLGNVRRSTYDAVDNLRSSTDALGNKTTYGYDALNRQTTVTDARSGATQGTTTTAYNEVGNITSITDPLGDKTEFTYDGLDRVLTETHRGVGGVVLGLPRRYQYDQRDNVAQIDDREDRRRTFTYDAYGRLTLERWYTPGGLREFSFTYDADDQMLTASDVDTAPNPDRVLSSYAYSYAGDPVRRLTSTSFVAWNSNTSQYLPTVTLSSPATPSASYNLADERLVQKVDPGGGGTIYNRGFAYDGLGRLSSVIQTPQSGTAVAPIGANLIWNRASELERIDRITSPLSSPATVGQSTYAYDKSGRLSGLTHVSLAGMTSTPQGSYQYSFDRADRVTRMQSTSAAGAVTNSDFRYDAIDQLTAADHTSVAPDEAFAYDKNGNRSGLTYDNFHRLTNDGTYTYEYNNEGTLKKRTKNADGEYTQYLWDFRNRLAQIDVFTLAGVRIRRAEYKYDAFDRRIETQVDMDGGAFNPIVTDYVYDGDDVVLARSGAGAVQHRYLHGPLVDQVLADEKVDGTPGTVDDVRWALADHQQSVRRLVKSDGTAVADILYDSFGKVPAGTTAPDAVDFLFGYTGQQYDKETGLSYYKARYYDPQTSHFLSEDPAHDGVNPYRYVGNDPLNRVDPTGLRAGLNSLGGADSFGLDYFRSVQQGGIGGGSSLGGGLGSPSAASIFQMDLGSRGSSPSITTASGAALLGNLWSSNQSYSSTISTSTFSPIVDAPNRGMIWVPENAANMNPAAAAYEAGTPGARSSIATRSRIAPALQYNNPNPNGNPFVRFDGQDWYDPRVLIDRKWNVIPKADQINRFGNAISALGQNPDYSLRIEVPTSRAANDAARLLQRTGAVGNPQISVEIVPPGQYSNTTLNARMRASIQHIDFSDSVARPVRMPLTAGERWGNGALGGVAIAATFLQFRSLGSGDPNHEALGVFMNPLVWPLAVPYYAGVDSMPITHSANVMNREAASIFNEQESWINWVRTQNASGSTVGPNIVTRARDYMDSQAAYTEMFGMFPSGRRLSQQEAVQVHQIITSPSYERLRNQFIGNEPGRSGR